MLLGKQLGPYLIEKEIGSGAMGSVFRARNVEKSERVAIKIVAPGLLANENALRRFQREIAILKQLDHPNIAHILRSGKYHEAPFYVMEYLEGESLDKLLARRLRLTWEEVVAIGTQLCAALQYAHDKGIIHRDLKPSNLMILKDGTIKLTDFGIAKDTDVTALTAANSTVGTAAYMSPEQCRGVKDLTPKSDLYSMGVMFYELLTGRKPFVAESIVDMFKLHIQGTFERPSRTVLEMPIWLDTLVCQLLEKEPDKRPLNADMVASSLALCQEKWEMQQSAGVDAATKRKIDKVAVEGKLDERDKEIARALLGRKKKKKKVVPVYRRGWFTLLIVILALGGLSYGGYSVFFKPPDPDKLFRTLDAQVKAEDIRDRRKAAEMIDDFLHHFPDDARADKVRGYRDQLAVDEIDFTTHNRRRGKFRPEHKQEEIAWMALDFEEAGKLEEASRAWADLLKNKASDDPNLRGWGLFAERYLGELEKVRAIHADLQARVAAAPDLKALLEKTDEQEALALKALWAQKQKEPAKALWNELKESATGSAELRRWYLLASWQARDGRD